jgi:hypothetical protein
MRAQLLIVAMAGSHCLALRLPLRALSKAPLAASPAVETRRPFPDLAAIGDAYDDLTKRHYLPCAFAQAGALASLADVATQLMETSKVDGAHVLAMSTVASTMSGAANAVWLRQLEERFPGRKADAVVSKTLIHAVILASIINSAYLAGVPACHALYAGGGLPANLVAGWSPDEFVTLTKLEICMFIPYNSLAFSYVPPRVRPLTHALVSATFNVAVSAVTLGYFDAWVDRVLAAAAGG